MISLIKKDAIFYGIAVIAERLISFLIIPILTKNLSQEFYGVWTQIIVTVGLLSPVVLMGFSSAAVRFLAGEEDSQKISSIFHWMSAIVLSISFLAIVIALLFGSTLSKVMFGNRYLYRFVYLFGFFLLADVSFELILSFLRAQKKIQTLSVYYFLKNAGRVIVLTLGILLFRLNFFYTVISIVALQLGLIVFMYLKDIFNKVGFNFCIKKVPWKKIICFSLPLVPYTFSIWGNNFADRYFILHILDIKQVSIYAVSYSLAAIIAVLYGVIGFILYPHITELWNKGEKKGVADMFDKAIAYYLFFVFPLIAILTIFSNPIIQLLSTSAYLSGWQVVFWLALGISIFGLYQLNIFPMLLENKTFLIFIISIAALMMNIVLNVIMIPRIGILGAAIATFISNTALTLLTIMNNARHISSYTFPWKTVFKIMSATSIMCLVLFSVRHYADINNFWRLLSAVILGIGIYGVIDLLSRNSFLRQLKANL